MKFTDQLKQMNACTSAVRWVGGRGIKTAWRDCKRADWMLWLAGHLDIDRELLVLAACDCAETALKYIPAGEDRPAIAIQTARDWCAGKATLLQVRAAAYADAAAAAADAAHAADAADAADAAVYAADAAAYAADAADAAADAAAYNQCAELVRQRIPVELIVAALKAK